MSLFIKKKTLKKTISVVTTLTTMVWLSGVSMLAVPVAQAAVVDGSLIKSNATNSDGTPTLASLDVYIVKLVGTKKFKRLILNPTVFTSYGHLNWNDIQTVSQAVMGEYTTSSLVRVDTDPDEKVYAMAPDGDIGSKSWVNLTSTQFLGVTGSDADAIYTINAVDGGNYTAVTDVTTTTQLTTFYTTGVLPGVAPVPAAALAVALSADTPASATHASGTAYNGALKLSLTAGSDGDANVTSLTLTRGGVSIDSNISGVAVFDSAGVRHGNFVTFADTKALVNFSSDPIVVPAGQTVSVTVKTNITTGTLSGTYYVSVAQASDIGTTSTVTGTFPVAGNTHSLATGTDVVGAVTVDAVLVHDNGANDANTVSVNLGTTNQEIARFRFVAGANEDVKISKITMYNNGNTNDADVKNIKLVGPDGTVLSTVTQATNRNVVFDLSASPYTITKGNTKDLSVRIDAVGGSTRNVRFVIQNDYDIEVVGKSTGSGILTTAKTTVDGAFPVGDTSGGGANCAAAVNCINKLTVSAGTVTFNKAGDSMSGNVAVGATNVALGKWEFTPNGEDMEIRQVAYTLTRTTALTGTFRIQVNGSTVYSVAPASMGATGVKTTVTLNSYPTLKAGEKAIFTLVGDISTTASAGVTYLGALDIMQVKRISTNDLVDPGVTDTSANTLTVSAAALSVNKNASFPNSIVVAGLSGAKIGSYNITASSTEDVAISSITVGLTNITNVSNLMLKVGSTQYGSTVNTPAASNVISISDFTVAKGTTTTLDAYITTNSATTGTEITSITALSATGKSSGNTVTATGLTATGQTITLSSGGALTIVLDTTNTPVSQVLHSGLVDNTLLAVRLSSDTAEAVKITTIQITSSNGDTDLKDLKLFVGGAQVGSTVQLVKGAALFSDTNGLFTIPQDSTVILYVKGSTTTSGTMNSQATVNVAIDYIEGLGVSGSATIKPGTTLETTWTSVDAAITTADLVVGNTAGFHKGDVILAQSNANGGSGSLGIVLSEPTSTTVLTAAVITAVTADAGGTVTKIASGAWTAASGVNAVLAGSNPTVTSTKGFNVGDPVIMSTGNDVVLGYVSAILTGTSMTVMALEANANSVDIIAKIGTDTISTSATASATVSGFTKAATAITVGSVSGFNVGDMVFAHNTLVAGTFGIVTAVGTTTLTISSNAAADFDTNNDLTLEGTTTVVRVGAINPATTLITTTSADADGAADNGVTLTVGSTKGFGASDVVLGQYTAEGAILGRVTSVTDTTTMAVTSAADGAAVATRVTRLPGAASASKLITMHDVEPTISAASTPAGGASTGQSGQEVAKFNVLADGDRNLNITSLNVQANGSNLPWNYVTSYDLYSGSTLLASATPLNTTVTHDASDVALTGTTIKLCSAADDEVNAAGEIQVGASDGLTALNAISNKIAVNDKIVIFVDTTNYITATVTAKQTGQDCGGGEANDIFLTVSNSSTTGTAPTSNTANAVKSFNVIFDSNSSTPLASQTITAGSSTALTVKADTTSVRTGLGAGTTASYNVKINGTQASTGGLTWGYTPSGGNAISSLTVSDSYPISGPTFTY